MSEKAQSGWPFWHRMLALFLMMVALSVLTTVVSGRFRCAPYAPGGIVLVLMMRALGLWGAGSTVVHYGWWVVGGALIAGGCSGVFAAVPAKLSWLSVALAVLAIANTYVGVVALQAVSY
jgi:hypothetical protein